MVFQLSDDVAANLMPFTSTPSVGTYAVVVADIDHSSVVFNIGRRVNVLRVDRDRDRNRIQVGPRGSYDTATYVGFEQLAELRPAPIMGMNVVGVDGLTGTYLGVGEVTNWTDTYVTVRDAQNVRHQWYCWLQTTGDTIAAVPAPVVEPLSDYWFKRIMTAAKAAKRRNSWCSEYDRIIKDMIGPALAERGLQVKQNSETELHEVIGKNGKLVAAFASAAEATEYATKKNSDIFSLS